MVKIRMEGERDQLAEAVDVLDENFRILSVSKPYANRNSVYYRMYIEAEPLAQPKEKTE